MKCKGIGSGRGLISGIIPLFY